MRTPRFIAGITALSAAFSAALSVAAPASAAATTLPDDIVVIVHKDNDAVVDRGYLRQLYTGALRGWPDGTPAVVLDQPDSSPVREQFCADVLGRSQANVRAIWAQNIFTGRGLPPRVAADADNVKRLVAGNRYAVGYVKASQLDASVRALPR